MRTLVNGLIAGAVGTSALNAVTYLDMLVRARGASSTPNDAVQKMADDVHVNLGEGERADNRKEAVGALLGFGTGAGAGLCYAAAARERPVPWPVGALALGTLAMLGSNVPLAALGVTDPREWSLSGWVSDIVPHLVFGAAAYAAYERLN
ncbi:hypothetical protein ACFOY4_02495 [Actinomadura syzygii]|uniref:DUF1440 domain-containing protein n=1 Tax=Actinomadura syzygii TaxID=1427538 RepID=A0A5D0UKP1_9ACTN|nr:hypothetical protein [Actinomadura syzygii]TYC17709.1 hypothetical protein FXF65_06955 [Actinomadura syzygii]